ncbi:MAG: FAD-binding oxidoreductase [Gammaproteobacteria bacterium]|nr:FAD-binding oxidoreductase [Gammaproteobacteria bacterium]
MSMNTDVIIIGGGIMGLMTALLCAEKNLTVTVLDKGELGRESSGAAGGILSALHPWRAKPIINQLVEDSKLPYQSLIERLEAETEIKIGYRKSGLLILDPEAEKQEAIDWAIQHKYPFELLTPQNLENQFSPHFRSFQEGLWFPDVFLLNPPRLLKALTLTLQKKPHVTLSPHEAVCDFIVKDNRCLGVKTIKRKVMGGQVIVTAGAWSHLLLSTLGITLAIQPIRGQILSFSPLPETFQPIVLFKNHYLLSQMEGRILAGSTVEDVGFSKEVTEEAHTTLKTFALNLWPPLKEVNVLHHWAGLRPGTPDGVPFIDRVAPFDNIWINSGHFRNGIAQAPASCQWLLDKMHHEI